MNFSTTRRNTLLIFCILLLSYAYVLPRRVDWSQLSRLSLVRAMVERDTVQIDAYVSKTGEFAIYEGHAYTEKAPGPSFIGLPIYSVVLPLLEYPVVSSYLESLAGDRIATNSSNREQYTEKLREFAAQYILTLCIISIPAAAAGALLYHFLRTLDLSEGLRALIVLAYGLGTPAATYAGNFYSHQLVASLCFGAFVLLVWLAQGQGNWLRALLVGLLLGYAVISEYPTVIIALLLGIYAWRHLPRAQVAAVIAGGTLPMILLAIYDITAFDTPLPVSYRYSVLQREAFQTGFMGITYPDPRAFWGLTFGPFRGLFMRAPWMLLALPGFVLWWQREQWRDEFLVAAGICMAMLCFYASTVLWWGGSAAGPRHLISILPFLTLGAVPAMQASWYAPTRRLLARVALVALVVLSVLTTWAEAVAQHNFPAEDKRTWAEWVFPAWQQGYITDSFGTFMGLHGGLSLLPLALLVLFLVLLLSFSITRAARAEHTDPLPPNSARSDQQGLSNQSHSEANMV